MSLKVIIPEVEIKARRELSDQIKIIQSMGAWKHINNIFNRIEEQATKDEDNIPLEDLQHSIALIAEARGKRKAIEKIHRDLDFLLNGYR